MLVRTLSIKQDDQNVLTAAVLFGFAIPELNQNFLAYSLNEDVGPNDSRVYLVLLYEEADGYSLHALTSDEDWQRVVQTFTQILREVITGHAIKATDSFYLLDFSEQTVTSPAMREHRTLNVTKDSIVKFLNAQLSNASAGVALETAAPATSDEVEIQGSSDDQSEIMDVDAEHFLTEIQVTFEEFSELAENLTLQKEQHQLQQETLASRELELQEREFLFAQKKEILLQDLHNYSEQKLLQNKRQSDLECREKALQRKAIELSIKLKKLNDAKDKLNIILKTLKLTPSKT